METLLESMGEFRCLSMFRSIDRHEYFSVIGKSILCYSASDGENKAIISATSLPDIRACASMLNGEILVVLGNSSIMLVPAGATMTSSLRSVVWPVQPCGVQVLAQTVLITCEKNLLCEVAISSILPHEMNVKPVEGGNILWAQCIGAKVYAVTMSGVEMNLLCWLRDELSPRQASAWYSPETAYLKKRISYSFARERVVGVCSTSTEAVFVVFGDGGTGEMPDEIMQKKKKVKSSSIVETASASSVSANRVVKVSLSGEELFNRSLTHTVLKAGAVDSALILLYEKKIELWDTKYGVLSHTVEFESIISLRSRLSSSLLVCSTSSSGEYEIVFGETVQASNNSSGDIGRLKRMTIQNPNFQSLGTLYQAFGALKKVEVTVETKEKDYKILSGLPNRVKREISKAQKKLEKFSKIESSTGVEDITEQASNQTKLQRSRRFIPLDVPLDVCEEFLGRFMYAIDLDLSNSILPSDWTAFKVILSTGTVMVSKYPQIIASVVSAGRFDVIQCIAQYCHDLTEKQAISLLVYTMALSDNSLSLLRVVGDEYRIEWGSKGNAGMISAEEKDKKQRKRKASVEEEKGKLSEVLILDILQAMLASLLNRRDVFSHILLAESIRSDLSVGSSSIILRTVARILRGLSPDGFNDIPCGVDLFGEEQVRRAVTWAEAIVDAHFSSFALQLSVAMSRETYAQTDQDISGGLVQRAILKAAETVSTLESSKDEVEALVGSWEQILAMNHFKHLKDKRGKLLNTSPPVGIYQLETLPLVFL